ncbi:hypothetical protein AQS8620_01127 [Aquimixticola soesokkakensis]|uniref:Uncharacterized protein n=1 Tax=Aquimixticola soesokkakensis TaxID=1519096 RepID=A0A1Y5SAB3_9RHOB|nr:tetratricopeptide repeat protein [Aquimixticola soesokkakensis]SLN33192.1 hypothetical protein AQS8620_01127 [Aquimixticola soesokkakensis]
MEGLGNSKATGIAAGREIVRMQRLGVLRVGSRANKLLRYLVRCEVTGTPVKAYAIAVDVLGRSRDFDPSTDSIVRVEIGRLRKLLDAYFDGQGADAALSMRIPVGQNTLVFARRATTGSTQAQVAPAQPATDGPLVGYRWPAPDARVASPAQRDALSAARAAQARLPVDQSARKLWPVLTVIVATAVLVGAIAGILWQMSQQFSEPLSSARAQSKPLDMPVVRVEALRNDLPAALPEDLRDGLGGLLHADLVRALSAFRTLRVQDRAPSFGFALTPIADYVLTPVLRRTGGGLALDLTLTSTLEGVVIWSGRESLPVFVEESFGRDFGPPVARDIWQARLETIVRRSAVAIAAPTGFVARDVLRRAQAREAAGTPQAAVETAYTCTLRWHAFDETKEAAQAARVRFCLNRFLRETPQEARIWASWSMMRFLDWTRSGATRDDGLLADALAAADRAVWLDPSDAVAEEYRGSILMALGREDEALRSYTTAMRLNPATPDMIVVSGWYLAERGDWQAGIDLVNQAMALSASPPGWYRIPLALDAFRRGEDAQALEQAQLMLSARDERGRVIAAAALRRMGDLEGAEQQLRQLDAGDAVAALRRLQAVFASEQILGDLAVALGLARDVLDAFDATPARGTQEPAEQDGAQEAVEAVSD